MTIAVVLFDLMGTFTTEPTGTEPAEKYESVSSIFDLDRGITRRIFILRVYQIYCSTPYGKKVIKKLEYSPI